MKRDDLVRRIAQYLIRTSNNDSLNSYPLEKVDVYEIVSGANERGDRHTVEIIKGRYVDALARAVNLDKFVGENYDWGDGSNPNHGYVVKARIRHARYKIPLGDLKRQRSLENIVKKK